MKQLVLAEKPSVGRDIARVLKCKKPVNGGLEGDRYIVTWALGHLVELKDPEGYDKKYKIWKMEDLPMIPEKMQVQVIGKTAKQYKAVTALMNRKDVGTIIIATDAGREGELVARWIIKKAGVKKNANEKRSELLCQYLQQEFGITEYRHFDKQSNLTPDTLCEIIRTRNDLTHRADTSKITKIMYHHMLPILQCVLKS